MSHYKRFAKIPSLPLALETVLFQLLPKIHDHGGSDQSPILKRTALLFGMLPFCDHRWSSRRSAFALPNRELIAFVPPFVTRAYPPRYLNFSTCCSVMSLTSSAHCFAFLERHDTSVFLVVIFIPLAHKQQITDQVHVEEPVWKMQVVLNRPQTANVWYCSFQ